MNIFKRTGDLLFDQKKFFAEEKSKKVGWAFLIVVISGIIAAIVAYFATNNSVEIMANIPAGMGGIAVASSIISAFISTIIGWLLVSLLFFICLKLFGHSDCKYSGVLRVQGYVMGLCILETVFLFLVSFIGAPAPIATLLLAYAFMAWSIPIWFFGFKSISTKISRKGLWASILVPVIIIAVITIFTSGLFS